MPLEELSDEEVVLFSTRLGILPGDLPKEELRQILAEHFQ